MTIRSSGGNVTAGTPLAPGFTPAERDALVPTDASFDADDAPAGARASPAPTLGAGGAAILGLVIGSPSFGAIEQAVNTIASDATAASEIRRMVASDRFIAHLDGDAGRIVPGKMPAFREASEARFGADDGWLHRVEFTQ